MTLQVFISYKSEYRDIAREVKKRLLDWQYDTWLDVDSIAKGTYWPDEIDKGLISSDVLVGVVTKEAFDSRPIKLEWDYFLYEGKTILPCKYDDVKPPPRYITIQHIDFTQDKEKAFAELKERLAELASSIQPAPSVNVEIAIPLEKPGAAALADFLSEVDLDEKPEEAALSSVVGGLANIPESLEKERAEPTSEKAAPENTKKKRERVDDGLFDLAPMEPTPSPEPPKSQPAQPQSTGQQAPSGFPAAQPATPVFQPSRQADFVPQPAPLGAKRSRPILWPLAAVASLILIVGVLVLISSNAALTTATQQPQGINPLVWVGIIVLLGVVGVFGWRWFARSQSAATPDAQTETKNRATMLQNVEDFWLKGVLDPALEAGSLDIGLSAAPGAVLRHKDYGDYALPPNSDILDVFNDLNRELLILGAPGGGKTVLLLQLARELIAQARQDTSKAIPVVFNLSSWAADRKPLADWLVDELRQKYQVPKKVASSWVEGEKLLLLLDGLDEVADQYRNACVDAINAFRQKYRTVDLAICSRAMDYDALTSKLDVRGAIVLEPLSQPIIDAYLDRPELASLRQVMTNDAELREMSQVPFLLNAMAYAYQGAKPTNLQFPISDDQAKARRTHLFDRWVEKRLAAKPSAEYTASKARHWLKWLANKMQEHGETIFKPLYLQVTWLDTAHQHFFDPIFYLGVFIMLIGLVFISLISAKYDILHVFIPALCIALISTILASLCFALVGKLMDMRSSDTRLAPSASGKFRTAFSNLADALENFGWPKLGLFYYALNIALPVVIYYLLVRSNEPLFALVISLISCIVISIIPMPIGFLLFFRTINVIDLDESLGSNNKILSEKQIRKILGPIKILSLLLYSILIYSSVILYFENMFLRIFLQVEKKMPWNYARFLDYCVNAGLMRKVGGGYIFAHRYLMEYFAEMGSK